MREASTESTAPPRRRHHGHARVDRHRTLHAGAHQRRLRAQRRHRLALHVRAHQRAVGVVVLQERNQRSRHRDDLLRRDVHVVDAVARHQRELALIAAGHQLIDQLAVRAGAGVGLRDRELAFLDRRQVVDAVGHAAVLDAPIGRLEEAVLIGARVHRERIDQADVRSFRRLDRAHPAVMRRVHVAHLEAGALARQAARPQRRDAPLVRDLGQRVVLVHELRQLRGAEELLDRGGHRLGVDHLLRHQRLGLGDREPLLDRALDAHQADAEGVLRHLADAAHAPIAEVIDVIDGAVAVADVDQHLAARRGCRPWTGSASR